MLLIIATTLTSEREIERARERERGGGRERKGERVNGIIITLLYIISCVYRERK